MTEKTAMISTTSRLGRRGRSRTRAYAAHAHVGDRNSPMLGDGTRSHATLVAIYTRGLGFGDALVAPGSPPPSSGIRCCRQFSCARATRRRHSAAARLARATRGWRPDRATLLASADDADRATNRWLTPLFVAIIVAFTSIAVVNTLAMIALRRGRELARLRLTGATHRQVRSMARWEGALIVAIGLGVGLLSRRPRSCP